MNQYKWILYALAIIFSLGLALISKPFRAKALGAFKATKFDNELFAKGVNAVKVELLKELKGSKGLSDDNLELIVGKFQNEFKNIPFVYELLKPTIDDIAKQLTAENVNRTSGYILKKIADQLIETYNKHF